MRPCAAASPPNQCGRTSNASGQRHPTPDYLFWSRWFNPIIHQKSGLAKPGRKVRTSATVGPGTPIISACDLVPSTRSGRCPPPRSRAERLAGQAACLVPRLYRAPLRDRASPNREWETGAGQQAELRLRMTPYVPSSTITRPRRVRQCKRTCLFAVAISPTPPSAATSAHAVARCPR